MQSLPPNPDQHDGAEHVEHVGQEESPKINITANHEPEVRDDGDLPSEANPQLAYLNSISDHLMELSEEGKWMEMLEFIYVNWTGYQKPLYYHVLYGCSECIALFELGKYRKAACEWSSR